MRKIIDGKRYDTETAKLVASYDNMHSGATSASDFSYYEEALYRTAKGSWFLAGEGNAMSKYARRVDQNSTSGGSDLRALSTDDARRWLERHQETEALEEHFADSLEDA